MGAAPIVVTAAKADRDGPILELKIEIVSPVHNRQNRDASGAG